jgi:hypothetical protein
LVPHGHSHAAAALTERAVDAEHDASLIRTALRLPHAEPEAVKGEAAAARSGAK